MSATPIYAPDLLLEADLTRLEHRVAMYRLNSELSTIFDLNRFMIVCEMIGDLESRGVAYPDMSLDKHRELFGRDRASEISARHL